jgi:P27 family predicted phage terminase small subunit
MPGPRRQPTALRVMRGNPGKRRINHHEPQHGPFSTACPAELTDPVAQAEWTRVAPGLILCGQVTVVDRAALMGYCQKYAQWQALEQEAMKHPFLVRAPTGYPIPNPALGMANKTFKLMLQAAAELGMTPAGRSRVSVSPPAAAGGSTWADVLR